VTLAEHGFEFAILSLVIRTYTAQIDDARPPPNSTARRPLGVTNMFQAARHGGLPGAPQPAAFQLGALVSAYAGLYGNYRNACTALIAEISKNLDAVPAESRGEMLRQLADSFPSLKQEPEFKALAARSGLSISGENTSVSSEAIALRGLQELAEDFLPGAAAPGRPDEVAAFLTRLQETLDTFLRSFIPLRDGYKQFESEMAIRRMDRSSLQVPGSVVSTAQDAKELARILLDWRNDAGPAVAGIESTFADLMIHQVAMLNGVMTGVRSLLAELSPAGVERAAETGALQVGPFRYQSLWRAYEERYADIAEDERQIYSLLFGRQFAQAYDRYRGSERPTGDGPPRASQWPPRRG
jgi:type VI secretion system protein ImpI